MSLSLSEGMCLIVPESLTCITLLVFLPSNGSQAYQGKENDNHASYNAGKDTKLNSMRELTPKHASKTIIIPKGIYTHATTIRCHDERAT